MPPGRPFVCSKTENKVPLGDLSEWREAFSPPPGTTASGYLDGPGLGCCAGTTTPNDRLPRALAVPPSGRDTRNQATLTRHLRWDRSRVGGFKEQSELAIATAVANRVKVGPLVTQANDDPLLLESLPCRDGHLPYLE
jgi:hypothetical protein